LLADRPDPRIFARDESVLGDEQRDELLRLAAPVEHDAGRACNPAGFYELASSHCYL
jgi:hypothetical protein